MHLFLSFLAIRIEQAQVLGTIDPSNPAFQEYLCELRSISGATGILPTSYTITGDLLKVDPEPFSSRGYGDVYEGILSDLRICVKRIRLCEDNHKQIVKVNCYPSLCAVTDDSPGRSVARRL